MGKMKKGYIVLVGAIVSGYGYSTHFLTRGGNINSLVEKQNRTYENCQMTRSQFSKAVVAPIGAGRCRDPRRPDFTLET
jgi:hypothetical protein